MYSTARFTSAIGQVGKPAAGRHAGVALERGLDDRIQTQLHARRPRRAIADLRRAALPGLVALAAGRGDDLLAGAPFERRRRAGDRRGAGGLHPAGAGLVDHERDGALHLDVLEVRVAALRRHRADARDRVFVGELRSLRDHFRPRRLVADLVRAGEPVLVAGLAHLLVDLVAGQRALGTARHGELDLADRLDPVQHRMVVVGRALGAAGNELGNEDDQRDRDDERRDDDDDELLPVLDRGFVLVIAHGRSWSDGGRDARGGVRQSEIIPCRRKGRHRRWTLVRRAR